MKSITEWCSESLEQKDCGELGQLKDESKVTGLVRKMTFKPSCLDPYRQEKINLNFYILYTFTKPFEALQRSLKIKI